MGKLLCISYRFAPETYPLAIRVDNFVKHLSNSFEIEAITAAEDAQAPDNVNTHHVKPRVPTRMIRRLRKLRLGKLVPFLFWPDMFLFWIWPAYKKAKALIKANRPDAIVVFMMPYSQGLVGILLKRKFGIPLILNLNDSPTCSSLHPVFPSRLHFYLAKKLESLYIRSADAIVYVSKQNLDRLKADVPSATRDRMHLIRRGAPTVQLDTLPEKKDNNLHIVYGGGMGGWYAFTEPEKPSFAKRMYTAWEQLGTYRLVKLDHRSHSPVYLGLAIKQLIERKPEWKGRITLDIYGNKYPMPLVNQVLQQHGIEDLVNINGVLPHKEVLQKVFGADALFMALPERNDGSPDARISAKTYEYLMSERPIIAGLSMGENTRFLSRFDGVHIVSPRDVDAMETAIENLATRFFAGESLKANRSQHFDALGVPKKARDFEAVVRHAMAPDTYPRPDTEAEETPQVSATA
ncbi:MAG: glycosyltransferase [Bacteroidota bacterium]